LHWQSRCTGSLSLRQRAIQLRSSLRIPVRIRVIAGGRGPVSSGGAWAWASKELSMITVTVMYRHSHCSTSRASDPLQVMMTRNSDSELAELEVLHVALQKAGGKGLSKYLLLPVCWHYRARVTSRQQQYEPRNCK
jgi:hypothetical protein